MEEEAEYIRAYKGEIIREMFVSTADADYVAARWCDKNKLVSNFFWLAVHAIEKYCKASLLFNGRSSQGYGHDIVRLYKDVSAYSGNLLPDSLDCSGKIDSRLDRGKESTIDFLDRIYSWGNANNRYFLYGYSQRPGDIHKIDDIVFSIRRLCNELDGFYCNPLNGERGIVFREFLGHYPSWWDQGTSLKLGEIAFTDAFPELRENFLAWNFAFGYGQEVQRKPTVRWGSHSSAMIETFSIPSNKIPSNSKSRLNLETGWSRT